VHESAAAAAACHTRYGTEHLRERVDNAQFGELLGHENQVGARHCEVEREALLGLERGIGHRLAGRRLREWHSKDETRRK
jgi:hypothetical protein